MGLFDSFKKSAGDLFIAAPPEAARQLVWRHPDTTIPNGARLTVRADEVVVFFREGAPVGTLDAGVHVLDTANVPFLDKLLVTPLTGGRHFITEAFFVRKAEHLHRAGPRQLGTFTDVASRLVVTLGFTARVGLRVRGPLALITSLGGQHAASGDQVAEFLDARLTSLLAACVGRLVAAEPITQVASNQHNEMLGQAVVEHARGTFAAEGLEITRFLDLQLHLDPSSEATLREHGKRLAELGLQREGAEIASQPGYAAYHLAQGQRAMLEGLGAGAAKGGITAPIMAVGALPPVLPPMPQGPPPPHHGLAVALPAPAPPTARQGVRRWYLRTTRGVEGPYGARQLVLRAHAEGLDASSASVRGERENDWRVADEDEDLATEFVRRADLERPRGQAGAATAARLFEDAFQAAVADGVLSPDAQDVLASLARACALAPSSEAAREYVRRRAAAAGCRVGAAGALDAPRTAPALPPPAPPPLAAVRVFVYSNGLEQVAGLGAESVANRVRATPDGYHMVWSPGMPGWAPAGEVEEIRKHL